jgi:hypothetical protein
MTIPLEDFYRTTRAAESSNNPNAANPNSSARGLYQFTGPTWRGVVRNYGQRYGIREDGLMDPTQQELAIRAITENEYLPRVQRSGRAVDPAELYLPHLLGGPTYSRLTSVDPNTPAAEAFRGLPNDWNSVYSVNAPVFRNQRDITAGQVLEMARAYHQRHSGRGGAPVGPQKAPEPRPAPPPVASSPAPTAPAPSPTPTSSLTTLIWRGLKALFQRRKE